MIIKRVRSSGWHTVMPIKLAEFWAMTWECKYNRLVRFASPSTTLKATRTPQSKSRCLLTDVSSPSPSCFRGKTFSTAAAIGGLMRAQTAKSAVIVAPKSVLRSWEKELKRVVLKCVSTTVITVLSSNATDSERRRILATALDCSPKRPHIVVTTYGMVQNATKLFMSETNHWDYIVLDEAHTVKNSTTQVSLACRSLARNTMTHRLMLTGTPLMNKPEELFVRESLRVSALHRVDWERCCSDDPHSHNLLAIFFSVSD
jgi:hypothetical protein